MLEKIWSKKNTLPFMRRKKANIIQNRKKRENYASKERLIPQIYMELQKVTKKQKSEQLHVHLQNQL